MVRYSISIGSVMSINVTITSHGDAGACGGSTEPATPECSAVERREARIEPAPPGRPSKWRDKHEIREDKS